MKMVEWLFWGERMTFLSMALTWSLLDTDSDEYFHLAAQFNLFWQLTSTLYCLLSLQASIGGTLPQDHDSQTCFEKNPGFWLERLGLMIWFMCSGQPNMQLIRKFCFGVFFPSLNVYFALWGYSREFSQKNSSDEEPVRVQRKEEEISANIEEVLFWVERLGHVVLTASWIIFSTPETLFNPSVLWTITNTVYYIIHSWKSLSHDSESRWGYHSTMILRIKRFPGFWLERMLFLPFEVFYPLQPKIWLQVYFAVILPFLHVYYAWFGYSREVRPGVQPDDDEGSGKANDETRNTKTPPQENQNMAPSQATSKGEEKEVQPDQNLSKEAGKTDDEMANTKTLPQEHQNMATTSNGKENDIKEDSLQIVKATEECHKRMEDVLRKMLGDQEERIRTAIADAIREENRREEDLCQGDNKDDIIEGVVRRMSMKMEEFSDMNKLEEENNELKELIEKYKEENRILEEKNGELAVKFAVAAQSSQLYRDLLHDPAVLISDVTT